MPPTIIMLPNNCQKLTSINDSCSVFVSGGLEYSPFRLMAGTRDISTPCTRFNHDRRMERDLFTPVLSRYPKIDQPTMN